MSGIQNRIQLILDNTTGSDLNSWEKTFLSDLKRWGYKTLSPKQEACLKKIEDKLEIQPEKEDDSEFPPLNYDDYPPF